MMEENKNLQEQEIKVSVVMPVYNAQDFLEKTLEDVTNQTLHEIEIICVDDGSTDNSREIIKQFAERDSRVRLVEQQNCFAGAARNHGMEYAFGKYIVFWDSDDMFREKALETMYLQAERQQSDICICAADRYDNNQKKYFNSDAYLRKKLFPDLEVFNKFDVPEYIFNLATNVPWNKMFLRSFVEKHELRFQEIRQANDTYFTLMAFFLADRITYVEDILISYRVNNSASLSGKASNTVFCAYDSYVYTLERMEPHKDYKVVQRSFQNRAISGFYHAMNIQTSFASYKQLYEKLVNEGFAKFDLLEKERDFFYDKWMYDDLHRMLEASPEEFLLFKSMARRLSVERGNSERNKLSEKFNKLSEKSKKDAEKSKKKEQKLEQQLASQKKQIAELEKKLKAEKEQVKAIKQTFSYRLGRALTWPIRKLRGH